jgi:ABC-2 type transport system permease protein
VNLFLFQLQWELRKLFTRKQTYIGFLAFVLFDLVVLGMMESPVLRDAAQIYFLKDRHFRDPANFSGLTVARFLLSQSLNLLGFVSLALVGGDVVAREVEDGTMRFLLARPVPLWQMLLQKWIACAVYTVVLVCFLGMLALGVGLACAGTGNLLIFAPDEGVVAAYRFGPGLVRYGLGVLLQCVNLLTVTSVAFLISCCNVKPVSAAAFTLTLFFGDHLLREVPYLEPFRHLFLTSHVGYWFRIYEPAIPWRELFGNSALLLAVDVVLIATACWIFSRRDIKA